MKDMTWEDTYKRRPARMGYSQGERESHHRSQNPFADRYLEKKHGHQESFNEPEQGPNYSDKYLGASKNPNSAHEHHSQELHYHFQQPPVQPVYPQEPQSGYYQTSEPVYQAYPPNNSASHTQWRFLDLRNKKQTGDLYKKILTYNKKSESNVFCFTSSTPREGVTTILTNLVDYIKNQGSSKRVVIIDANLNSPDLNNVFGLPPNCSGLKDVIHRRIDIQSALCPIGQNISVLCSGNDDGYSQGSLEPDDFLQVVNACKQFADYILIDCPPVLSASDAFSVLPAANVSFLVLQAVQVRRQVAEKALALLQNNECELGGAILNRVQQVIPSWVYRYI